MHIAFTFNVRHTKPGLEKEAQEEAEFDEPSTIRAIHDAIVANGYEVTDIEANEDVYDTFKTLRNKIDLVFNITEGSRGEIRESQIPAMLEFLGIPYTHSGALADAISLDKSLTKQVWQYYGLPTPRFVLVDAGKKPEITGLRFPLIVKPNGEGSSKGIFNDSLVHDSKHLFGKIRKLQKDYGGSVLVEEFLPGREFTVTVMGNPGYGRGVYVLPIVEQNYDVFPKNLQKLASYEAKWFFEDSLDNPHDAYICPATLRPNLQKSIQQLCIAGYNALHCRDVARIDLRLDATGKPHLLEINTLPGMIPDPNIVSYFPVASRAAGMNYTQMVGKIIEHARERLGI